MEGSWGAATGGPRRDGGMKEGRGERTGRGFVGERGKRQR